MALEIREELTQFRGVLHGNIETDLKRGMHADRHRGLLLNVKANACSQKYEQIFVLQQLAPQIAPVAVPDLLTWKQGLRSPPFCPSLPWPLHQF